MPTKKQYHKIRAAEFAQGFDPMTGKYPDFTKHHTTPPLTGERVGVIKFSKEIGDLQVIPDPPEDSCVKEEENK